MNYTLMYSGIKRVGKLFEDLEEKPTGERRWGIRQENLVLHKGKTYITLYDDAGLGKDFDLAKIQVVKSRYSELKPGTYFCLIEDGQIYRYIADGLSQCDNKMLKRFDSNSAIEILVYPL